MGDLGAGEAAVSADEDPFNLMILCIGYFNKCYLSSSVGLVDGVVFGEFAAEHQRDDGHELDEDVEGGA